MHSKGSSLVGYSQKKWKTVFINLCYGKYCDRENNQCLIIVPGKSAYSLGIGNKSLVLGLSYIGLICFIILRLVIDFHRF